MVNDRCWICGSKDLSLVKQANLSDKVNPSLFEITDSHYGSTGNLYRCTDCGFVQCPDFDDLTALYDALQDPGYETGRVVRTAQMREMLEFAARFQPDGRLVDIGAGSGMLVEEALNMGYEARGVEPSRYLQSIAESRGLPVALGTFPHPSDDQSYDVAAIIDVIEHVAEPMQLLSAVVERLSPEGIVIIATPDVSSLAARLLGYRWWHYRVAHVGYFNTSTLDTAMAKLGLVPIGSIRPAWYFQADYLVERIQRYLPRRLRFKTPTGFANRIVRINLYDSILVVFSRRDT